MELYQLNTFISVAECGNLTRAAREYHLSPSTVSAQIKALEEETGVILFLRTPKGMHLTPNGRDLLGQARKVTEAAAGLLRKAGRMREGPSGTLRVGMNTDPGFLDIDGIQRRMARSLPGITLSFIETQTFDTVSLLRRNVIDLGFHFGRFDDVGIFSLTLDRVQLRVVIPKRFGAAIETASLEALMGLPWIWTRQDCPYHREFRRLLNRSGLVPAPVADAVDETVVGELVKSGTGAALMRQDQALGLVKENKARIWQGPAMAVDFCVSCRGSRQSEQAVAGFFDAMKEKYETC